MTKKVSALHSVFIIDGVTQELTPAQLLDAVAEPSAASGDFSSPRTVIDETVDPSVGGFEFTPADIDKYLACVIPAQKKVPLAFSSHYVRERIAAALVDAIWCEGHFRLGDLRLDGSWSWNPASVGSMAAFYQTVQSAADYIDSLGLRLGSYAYAETAGDSSAVFTTGLSSAAEQDDFSFASQPFRSENPVISTRRACPSVILPDAQSWLVYIPFDPCDYRLGGSLLEQALDIGGGASPNIGDADYFFDCYEVVRELVEDGVVLSGVTVGEGGLLKALKQMASCGAGACVDVSGIMKAYQEKGLVRVLFSEVPGAVIQIRDIDFDYLDAELLLQDVAFFPLGHPDVRSSDIRVRASAKSGIQTILESLMQNAEGED